VTPPAPEPVALRSAAGVALIATTVLASAVGFLAASVVTVALPAIGRDLGSGVGGLQWVLTGYLVTVAALLLLSGALADRLGRRRVLAGGLLVMLCGSVLCAVAPTVGALIGARVIQGAGGAMLVPSSLALLDGTLRASDRVRGIGLWSATPQADDFVTGYAALYLLEARERGVSVPDDLLDSLNGYLETLAADRSKHDLAAIAAPVVADLRAQLFRFGGDVGDDPFCQFGGGELRPTAVLAIAIELQVDGQKLNAGEIAVGNSDAADKAFERPTIS